MNELYSNLLLIKIKFFEYLPKSIPYWLLMVIHTYSSLKKR